MAVSSKVMTDRLCSLNTPIRELPMVVLKNGATIAERAEGGIGGVMELPTSGVLTLEVFEDSQYVDYFVFFENRTITAVKPASFENLLPQTVREFFRKKLFSSVTPSTSQLLKEYAVGRLSVARQFDKKLIWLELGENKKAEEDSVKEVGFIEDFEDIEVIEFGVEAFEDE